MNYRFPNNKDNNYNTPPMKQNNSIGGISLSEIEKNNLEEEKQKQNNYNFNNNTDYNKQSLENLTNSLDQNIEIEKKHTDIPYNNNVIKNQQNFNNGFGNKFNNTPTPNNNIKKDNNNSRLGFIIFVIVSIILYKDFGELLLQLITTIFSFIGKSTFLSLELLKNILNGIVSIFLTLFLLSPGAFGKKLKNPLYTFSQNIAEKLQLFFKVGIINFFENRDNLIKIIYNFLLILITLVSFHYIISQVFINNDNIIKTISYIGVIITIGIYSSIMSKNIDYYNDKNVSESKNTTGKLTLLVLGYSVGLLLLLYFGEQVSLYIYDFIIEQDFLRKLL